MKYFYSNVIGMTPLTGINIDLFHGLVEIDSKARLRNIDDVFVFSKQCWQIYYIYTNFFRNDRSIVDWLSVVKTKSRSHVEVIQDVNDELTVRGDICFQLGKLIDLYRVALND